MRTSLVVICAVVSGCGDDGGGSGLDARPIDGMQPPADMAADMAIDTPPLDAPPSSDVTAACTTVCDRIAECSGVPATPDCVAECTPDLADCTAQEVMQVGACATQACGQKGEAVIVCLKAIACVDG